MFGCIFNAKSITTIILKSHSAATIGTIISIIVTCIFPIAIWIISPKYPAEIQCVTIYEVPEREECHDDF